MSLRHHAASVSCMTACFPTAALLSLHTDDDKEPALEMMHARLVRPEDVSGSRESVFSMPAIADSHGTALMYPPARQQYAIHSAVSQSFALAHQMVSPTV